MPAQLRYDRIGSLASRLRLRFVVMSIHFVNRLHGALKFLRRVPAMVGLVSSHAATQDTRVREAAKRRKYGFPNGLLFLNWPRVLHRETAYPADSSLRHSDCIKRIPLKTRRGAWQRGTRNVVMKRLGTGWIGLVLLSLHTLPANAQSPGGWYPIERPVYQAAVANYAAQPAAYAPATSGYPTVSTRWEPAVAASYGPGYAPAPSPTVTYAPVVTYAPAVNYAPPAPYMPVAARCVAPNVSYMPVVARYPAPTYVTYAPVAGAYPATPAPAGPRVWVHPKVYVEGQPIRNLLRAITP